MGLQKKTSREDQAERFTGNGWKIPRGIEMLVKQVLMKREELHHFLENPMIYADKKGIMLDPCERSILGAIDRDQWEMIIERMKPEVPERRHFLKAAAGLLGVFSSVVGGTHLTRKIHASSGTTTTKTKVITNHGHLQKNEISLGIFPIYENISMFLTALTPTPTPSATPTSYGNQPTNTPVPTNTPAGITPSPTNTFSPSATPTDTPIPTSTSIPTDTPTPCPTGTPTPAGIDPTDTPSPTVTPGCAELGAFLEMPSHFYRPGDPCKLEVHLCNPFDFMENVPFFVILQVGQTFYCAPGWTLIPEINYYRIDVPEGWSTLVIIEEFEWPDGVGEMANLYFWAGMTNSALDEALGHVDSWKFGYGG